MRLNRVLASVVAAAVMTAAPLVSVTSADASAAVHHSNRTAVTHKVSAEKAKKRHVTVNFSANGGKSFRFYGKVTPKGGNLRIALLYSATGKGKYKLLKKGKTSKSGSYSFTGLNKVGYYGIVAAPSKGYKASASKIQHIHKG